MPKTVTSDGSEQAQVEKTLRLLDAINSHDGHTQRSLAERLGIALGLTNTLLKRAIRKGLIKIHDIPARRYAYYLTAQGFQEKSRLVGEYLSVSLSFFRRARSEYEEAFVRLKKMGTTKVVLCGSGELAEIAFLAARNAGVEVICVIDPARNEEMFCGLPVVRNADEAGRADAFIVTDALSPQQTFDRLSTKIDTGLIITPDILHVSREAGSKDEGAEQ